MSVSRIPKNTVVKIDGEGTGVLNLQNLKLMKPFMMLKSKGSVFICIFLNIGLKLYTGKKADNGKYIFTFPISWGF